MSSTIRSMTGQTAVGESLEDMLLRHEGVKLYPYRDTVGKLTIGVGRNLDDNGITEDEAMTLLRNDAETAIKELTMQYLWFQELDETRSNAIVDMYFNLGMNRFATFKRMLTALDRHDYPAAAEEMLDSKWARQVGPRAQELSEMVRLG